jgi:hypothetical protein
MRKHYAEVHLANAETSLQEIVAAHQLEGFDDVFWNLGQVVAWVQTRSPFSVDALSDSTPDLARRDHSMPPWLPHFAAELADRCADENELPRIKRPLNSDDEVRRAVLRSLQAGTLTASGQRRVWLMREPIPSLEWADLTIDYSVTGEMIVCHRESHDAAWHDVRVQRDEVLRAFPTPRVQPSEKTSLRAVPAGFYALERAVLLLAKELDSPIWETGKMTADEIVAYEGLGQTTHYKGLKSILDGIALNLRDRKGNLPDDTMAQRLASYEKCQGIVREGLLFGDLRSFLQFEADGPFEQLPEAWQQADSHAGFDGGLIWSDGELAPAAAGWATILIDKDSFSDWDYPKTGPMAEVEAKERDKGGRPPEYDWDAIKEYALAVVKERGMPARHNRRLPSKAQLSGAIMDAWAEKGIELARPTVSRYVKKWLDELLS